jgi:hypothetical protein
VQENLLNLWARNAGSAQLAWSADHGATWRRTGITKAIHSVIARKNLLLVATGMRKLPYAMICFSTSPPMSVSRRMRPA